MLETDRLILKPLTYSQLLKYVACDNSLEVELKLNENPRNISPELKEALEQTILPNVFGYIKKLFVFYPLDGYFQRTQTNDWRYMPPRRTQ